MSFKMADKMPEDRTALHALTILIMAITPKLQNSLSRIPQTPVWRFVIQGLVLLKWFLLVASWLHSLSFISIKTSNESCASMLKG